MISRMKPCRQSAPRFRPPLRGMDRRGKLSLFAIVACQRSGTHLLRQVLNSNPRIAVVGEPFSPDNSPTAWHRYLRSLPVERAVASSDSGAEQLLDGFERHVRMHMRASPKDFGGVKRLPTRLGYDIKYNQLRSANTAFSDLRARPYLLDFFHRRSVRLIHLVRTNVVQVAISVVIANQRRIWHNHDGRRLSESFHIAPGELIEYAGWAEAERAEFERLSYGLEVLRCDYEDLVDDVQSPKATFSQRRRTKVLSRIAEFLRVSNQFCASGLMQKVINRPYCEVISNYDEMVDAVKQSQFSQFAETLC